MADEKEVTEVVEDNKNKNKEKEKEKGILSRIWNGLFRLRGDDFEKRLQYISKEEASILARMKTRSMTWRRTARNLIIFSVLLEAIAVAYAILTTRSVDMDWRMRALRVLPMFLLPGLSSALYSGLLSLTRMCDRRDQRTLDRLRAERQAKIDELKERTNYYTTHQLIQRYDPDPAAKAAAATVLASKLGADSGLRVFLGDESQLNLHDTGKSNDLQLAQSSSGLRKRNSSDSRSLGSNVVQHSDKEMLQYAGNEVPESSPHSPVVVEHHNPPISSAQDGGWIARLAASLVGEDPTQSFALICGNCHMHNGLARKEDFPFITYYCPHCHALNKPKHSDKLLSGTVSPDTRSSTIATTDVGLIKQSSGSMSPPRVSANSSPVATEVGEREASEKIVVEDPASH